VTASQSTERSTSERSAIVGVFDDRGKAQRAVEELRQAGFDDDQIGFAARGEDGTTHSGFGTGAETEAGSHAGTGAVAGGVLGGLLGAAAALLLPGIGPVVAGGILAATLGGAAVGAAAGGLIGALTGMGVPEDEARYYEQEVQSGRTIVTVKADGRYQEAMDILQRNGAYNAGSGQTADTDYTAGQSTGAVRQETMASTMGTERGERATGNVQREIRVPEVEERLEVEKRPVETGQVQVRRTVEEERQTVPVELRREEVHVEQRDVAERPLAPGEARQAFQEDTIRVPVHAEEAVARKEAVVTSEVVVNKEQTTERQELGDTVRRTEVHVENQGETVRPAGQRTVAAQSSMAGRWEDVAPRYRSSWQSRYGSSGNRWEDSEPAYRYGYEMHNDPRYQGRNFDEVEGDLQKDWAQRYPSNPWDKAKAYVRETWSDVKSAVYRRRTLQGALKTLAAPSPWGALGFAGSPQSNKPQFNQSSIGRRHYHEHL